MLPKEAKKLWGSADAVARIAPDTLVIKRVQPSSSFWNTWEQIGKVRPRVNKADLSKAVKQARSTTKRKRGA